MKNLEKLSSRLSFQKETIADLSELDLMGIRGGDGVMNEPPPPPDRSENSTRADFTCCTCTTL
ncbi:class I lanthipeptide [Olivibacter jilunii]